MVRADTIDGNKKRVDSTTSRRSGFVLLIVLATLVVAAVTLAALGNASLQRVVDAQVAQEQLQQRWGVICLEQALLPRASALFEQHDEFRQSDAAAVMPTGTIRDQIDLGGQRFDLILADEEAKANLNALYHEARQSHVEQTVRRLTGPIGQIVTRLNARTASGATHRRSAAGRADDADTDERQLPPAFLSWADVFDIGQLRRVTGDDRMLATLSSQLTLWGSGRLNVDRASDEVVVAVCGAVIPNGLARQLLNRYRDQPETELPLMLEREIGDEEDRGRLLNLVRRGSSTYSLWTEATSGRFRQQKFSVMQPSPEGQIKTLEFAL